MHEIHNRSRPLLHPLKSQIYPLEHPLHPTRSILLEDVFLACVLFSIYRRRNLTLVDVSVSEWTKHHSRPLLPAVVYHKLRHPERFDYVKERQAKLMHGGAGGAKPRIRCKPLADEMTPRGAAATASLLPHWEWCKFHVAAH